MTTLRFDSARRLWPDPTVVWVAAVLLMLLAGGVLGSPTVMTSGPLVVLLARIEWLRRARLEVARLADMRMVEVVDELIVGLRSGGSLRQASQRAGIGPRSASGDWSAPGITPVSEPSNGNRVSSDRLLMVTIGVLTRNGGPAVPALQRLRHTLVGRVNGRRQAEAAAAQAVASAGLLVTAPAFFVAVVTAVDPTMARFYLHHPLGAGSVAASVLLSGTGWLWICRTVSSALQEDR